MERIFSDLNAGMSCLSLYIGHRLGLFQALADAGPVTSQEFAQRTKYAERYLREWLSSMAAGGYIDYDPASTRFSFLQSTPRFSLTRTIHLTPWG
jgi:hypothetical protein